MNYEKFEGVLGTWAPKMRPFIEGKQFDALYTKLKADSGRGKKICPLSADTYRAFVESPMEETKVIFIGQDPYPWIKDEIYVADGLMMSCSHTEKLQPSLDLFYKGIEDDLYKGLKLTMKKNPDLTYLARQGILLMNSSLTCEVNKPGSHKEYWKPFMKFFFEEVVNMMDSLVVVCFGKQAQDIGKYVVPFHHWVLDVEHPAAASYKERTWNHDMLFRKINKLLKENNKEPIKWIEQYD